MGKDEKDERALQAGEALYALSAAVIRAAASQRPRLSLTSASTLAALCRLGPQRITELAALQGVAQPSMTTLVSGLEQAGFVERAPDPTDGRAVLVSVTAAGAELLAARRRARTEQVASLVRQMSDEDAAAIAAAVPALVRLRVLQENVAQSGATGAPKANANR